MEITKVTCMDVSCRWLNDDYRCTKKEIGLSWHQVMTAHDGRKDYLTCSGYEESGRAKGIREFFERMNAEGGDGKDGVVKGQ